MVVNWMKDENTKKHCDVDEFDCNDDDADDKDKF
jgi:hypothetical protein